MNRKSLHHYSELNRYQFVTFRTQESVDQYVKKVYGNIELSVARKQMQIDSYCDESKQGCYLTGQIMTIMMEHIQALEPEYYELVAVSIMPNHVHILFAQKRELNIIMQKIKGATAFQINKILNRKGAFWDKSYFDKAIRDEPHFQLIYDYIKNNAYKAKLSDADIRFYGIYSNENIVGA